MVMIIISQFHSGIAILKNNFNVHAHVALNLTMLKYTIIPHIIGAKYSNTYQTPLPTYIYSMNNNSSWLIHVCIIILIVHLVIKQLKTLIHMLWIKLQLNITSNPKRHPMFPGAYTMKQKSPQSGKKLFDHHIYVHVHTCIYLHILYLFHERKLRILNYM